jgi:hypothetical protein
MDRQEEQRDQSTIANVLRFVQQQRSAQQQSSHQEPQGGIQPLDSQAHAYPPPYIQFRSPAVALDNDGLSLQTLIALTTSTQQQLRIAQQQLAARMLVNLQQLGPQPVYQLPFPQQPYAPVPYLSPQLQALASAISNPTVAAALASTDTFRLPAVAASQATIAGASHRRNTVSADPIIQTPGATTHENMNETGPSRKRQKKRHDETLFPLKLYHLLEETEREGKQDIISWEPSGRAFRLLKPDKFFEQIVPHYFNHKNLGSFKRQLSVYGFDRINIGPEEGAYAHRAFFRCRPDLVSSITRVRSSYRPVWMQR